MTHESSADDESDALSGFGSEVDNFLHNVTDYYRLVPSHQAQVCPLFLLVSFALSKKSLIRRAKVQQAHCQEQLTQTMIVFV